MSYTVVKGSKQLDLKGKEIDQQIYLPLEALWDDYSILKEQKVIFLDSPLSNLEIALLNIDEPNSNGSHLQPLKNLLLGAGCKVHYMDSENNIPENINLVIVVNSTEGIFQSGYGGFMVNGSKKIASEIAWALARFFELDFVSPPVKEKNPTKSLNLWKKLTIPLVSIKWRKGDNHDLLLAISILMGLFRFATKALPLIDEKIFIIPESKVQEKDQGSEGESEIVTNSIAVPQFTKEKAKEESIDINKFASISKEDDEVATKKTISSGSRGKLVTNPSPKLKAHMKSIMAQQHANLEKEKKSSSNTAAETAAKLAGLGKG